MRKSRCVKLPHHKHCRIPLFSMAIDKNNRVNKTVRKPLYFIGFHITITLIPGNGRMDNIS